MLFGKHINYHLQTSAQISNQIILAKVVGFQFRQQTCPKYDQAFKLTIFEKNADPLHSLKIISVLTHTCILISLLRVNN